MRQFLFFCCCWAVLYACTGCTFRLDYTGKGGGTVGIGFTLPDKKGLAK